MNSCRRTAVFLVALCSVSLVACQKLQDKLAEAKRKVEQAESSKASDSATAKDAPEAKPAGGPAVAEAAPGVAEIRQLSEGDFSTFIATPDRVVVVDFYADWCGPCKTLGPILEKVVASHGSKAALGKLDVDQARNLASQQGVRSIPDVRIYIGGKKIDQFVGALPEAEVQARLTRHVAGLPKPAATAPAAPSSPVERPAAPAQPIAPMEKDWLPPGVERRAKREGN